MSSISNLNRMSGLMSGLDTEALIKAMTANTKARIDSQKQKVQILQWRQESYRSIISKISDFKSKYLDILSPTSIKAQAKMNKFTATSSNEKIISATAAAGAKPGTYTISKATAAKTAYFATEEMDGAMRASSNDIKLNFSENVEGKKYTVNITLDGVKKSVVYEAGATKEDSMASFLEAVNDSFKDVIGSDQKFTLSEPDEDGKTSFKFEGNDDVFHTLTVGANAKGVGLKKTTSNSITSSMTLGTANFANALQSPDGKYNITINGVSFEFNNNTTIDQMLDTVNNSKAGVKMSFSSISQTFTLESKTTGVNAQLNVYQSKGNLLNSLFNWEGSVGAPVVADSKKITYTQLEPVGTILSDETIEKFRTGNFGDEEGAGIYKFTIDYRTGDEATFESEFDIKSALEQYRSYKGLDEDHLLTDEEITEALNDAFKREFDGAGLFPENVFSFYTGTEEEGGKTILSIVADNMHVKFEGNSDFKALNNEVTNVADGNYVLASAEDYPEGLKFNVDGVEITVTAKEDSDVITIQDFIDAGVFELSSTGVLTAVKGTIVTGANEESSLFLQSIFGEGKDVIYGAKDGAPQIAYGSNATIAISNDGGKTFTTYTSANNEFTFDGMTLNVSNAENFAADSKDEYITIEVTKDTSGIMDIVKSFVEDYNTLLSDLYGETSTARPKSNGSYYDPLTEDMEEEMSEKEIEKWNEQAKIGWLYNDRNITTFLSNLRGTMSSYFEGFGLNDMGITLTKDWKDNGKLEINEAQLENAINTYGDKITEFFTNASNGLAAKLENVVDSAISTTSKGYGYLSALAGIEGTRTNTDNQIYRQIEAIQKVIERLNQKYENEQSRYWSRFTALETYMAQMQAQMSYFTDNSATGGGM